MQGIHGIIYVGVMKFSTRREAGGSALKGF